jgi:pyruvate, orthophosphate dikinase
MNPAVRSRTASVFGGGRSRLDGVTADEVGSKAFNLMRMDRAGLPVPPGFVLHTQICRDYLAHGRLSHEVAELVRAQVRILEDQTGLRFGDTRRPLLVSVRSGAPVSMPGMMDTLLNIGLSDSTLQGFIQRTGNPHLAWDSYR